MIYTNTPILPGRAEELLALDTKDKEIISYTKIEEWFTAWGGKCYVSFSGGKDSTVLAYLAANWLAHFRTPPWPLNLAFVNTGLEYPEIQRFVDEYTAWLRREFPRVTINLARLRPKTNVRQVIDRHGYPIISKRISGYIRSARNNPDSARAKMIRGEEKTIFVSGGTWEFLIKAPFIISDRCCDVMKKHPMNYYAAATGWKAITAEMATESMQRREQWERTGCNAFQAQHPKGKPMSFWTEQDVLHFLLDRNIPFASVYGEIVASDGENDYSATLTDCLLHCTGCQRTGCMFCGFGAHLEKGENRFQRMRITHPKHHAFCVGGGEYDPADGLWKPNEKGLGYARVLDYIGVAY